MNSHQCAAILIFLMTMGAMGEVKPSPTAHRTRSAGTHQQPAVSDAELEKAIRARFAASKISTHHFQVHVQGGVATLEGRTDVLQHKGTATRLAKSMGALKVVNHIEVSEAARQKAADNLSKGRRRVQVKRSDSTAARSDKRTIQ